MKLINFKLDEQDISRMAEVKQSMGASSNVEVFRRLLRGYMEKERIGPMSPKMVDDDISMEDLRKAVSNRHAVPIERQPKVFTTERKPKRELGQVDVLFDDGDSQMVRDPDSEGYVNPLYKEPKLK